MTSEPVRAGNATSWRTLSAVILLALIAVLFVHGSTVAALGRQWWTYLNHGFVLVALVGWVAWRDRASLVAAATPWWPASFVVLGAGVVWFVASIAGIQSIEQLALLVLLLGWALGVLGLGNQRRLLQMAAYLALALPIWGLANGILQYGTVFGNSILLAIVGLKATINGTYIVIPEGTFEVATGCSGLNYFASGMTIGFAYGELVPLTLRGRVLAVALMGTLSIVSNWIRVFLLVLIGHFTNMQSSLMTDHVWFGWVIFMLMVMLFVVLSPRIEARHSVPRRGVNEEKAGDPPPQVSRGHLLVVVGLTALAMLGPLSAALIRQLPRDASPAVIADLKAGAEWTSLATVERPPAAFGDTTARVPWAPQFGGAERHQVQQWVKQRDTVQVDRLVFTGNDHRHKLLADGNVMARERALLLDNAIGINEGARVRSLRQAVVRVDSTQIRAVIYWYRVGDTSTGVPLVSRLLQVPASLLRRAPSELVSVSTPCHDSNCNAAFASLREFVMGA